MSENYITEQVPDRRYFTIIPNLVDDLRLSAAAFRLYVHLKRVAGETGKCWQSTTTLAEHCGLSRHTVIRAKKELEAYALIEVTARKRPDGGMPYHEIKILDLWKYNAEHCEGGLDASDAKCKTDTLKDKARCKISTLQSAQNAPCKVQNKHRKKNTTKKNKEEEQQSEPENSDTLLNDEHTVIEDQSLSFSDFLEETNTFVEELKAVGLQGQLTSKELDHFQRQAAEHGEAKTLAYLRWCADEGWTWAKSYAVDRKHHKIADWELPAEPQDGEDEAMAAPLPVIEEGTINRETCEIYRDGRWQKLPKDGDVVFAAPEERVRKILSGGGTVSVSEFQTWVGGIDGYYRPATAAEVAAYCARMSSFLEKFSRPPIVIAEPEAQP